jgi:hypothetical protein
VTPIRIHPQNPKLFEFRGKPLVLLTATEHYGAVMNRPFRFERYLEDAADKRITLTRLFMLFRELQSAVNPYSTCKPESPDYIAPFERTGPGRALDGEPKFDLDRPNPEFFDRLHRFVLGASDLGIIVEVVLLSNTYAPNIWALNPLNAKNNINGLEECEWPDYLSQRHPLRFERQARHVERIVKELNRYDNVIYELCNEPGGNAPGNPNNPTQAEVNDWLRAIAQVIRETESSLPNRHLIVGQEAFRYEPWEQSSDLTFSDDMPYEVVNMHPLPGLSYHGVIYDQGQFMSKQLKLAAVRDYCLATYAEPKPVNLDEDNVASQYKDYDGWTIHRKRAWTTALSGGHYDYIDFSIINYCETGTPASQACIRTWMKHLSTYVHSLDLVRARPMPVALTSQPPHTCTSVFGVPGEDVSIYLADQRELDEPGVGQPIAGEISLDLSPGDYRVACFDPQTGVYSPWVRMQGGPAACVEAPEFVHDIVLRIRRVSDNE